MPKKARRGRARTKTLRLSRVRAPIRAGTAKTLELRLTASLLRALRRRVRETGAFALTAVSAGGTSHAAAHARLKL